MVALDDNAELAAGFQYGAFGELLEGVGDVENHTRRFNGKEQDELTGLSYYGFRYYDPLSITWTQADPKYRFVPDAAWDEPRRGNLYVFTGNNPIGLIDPTGEDWVEDAVTLTGGGPAANRAKKLASKVSDQKIYDESQSQAGQVGGFLHDVTPEGQLENGVNGFIDGARAAQNGDVGEVGRQAENMRNGLNGAAGLTAIAVLGARVLKNAEPPRKGARNPKDALNLNKSLASEQQMGEVMSGQGKIIAGKGHKTPIRDEARLVSEYGGPAGDWQKVTSSTHKAPDGTIIETHAYQNGEKVVEPKTKIDRKVE